MNEILVVIKNGSQINLTLSSLLFDQHGTPTGINYTSCNEWIEGVKVARKLNYTKILFLNSGTVFKDSIKFLRDICNYPHQGVIGHIVDPLDDKKFFYLHDQAFFIDISLINDDAFILGEFESPRPKRSDINMHDDYTPLWIAIENTNTQTWNGNRFGEKIIAKQIKNKRIVANWQKHFRENKLFLYDDDSKNRWLITQQSYIDQAENQLWIFNNEPIRIATEKILIAPASGLFWVINLLESPAEKILLVDISHVQLNFAQHLLKFWNGDNYGQFVFDYMKKHNIIHFNIDQPNLNDIERLKLKNPKVFISTVNDVFDKNIPVNFKSKWNNRQQEKIEFYHDDMIKFLPNYVETHDNVNIWKSNILNYKYTLLKNSSDELNRFTNIINNAKVIELHAR